MVYMEDLLYFNPLSPVARHIYSESLLSPFHTVLRWSYDERNSFGAREHLRTILALRIHLFVSNSSLEGACPVLLPYSQYLLKEYKDFRLPFKSSLR
jgi:hypothetical protein